MLYLRKFNRFTLFSPAMIKSVAVTFAAVIGLACITVSAVNASTLTWELQNVTFQDGGTATGSFGFDADTNIFSSVNISTSTNGALGATYGSAGSSDPTRLWFAETGADLTDLTGASRILWDLNSAMTNAGGIIALSLPGIWPAEAICTVPTCFAVGTYRDLASGMIVSAVPIPAAVWLFGTGILGLIGFSRRRKAA